MSNSDIIDDHPLLISARERHQSQHLMHPLRQCTGVWDQVRFKQEVNLSFSNWNASLVQIKWLLNEVRAWNGAKVLHEFFYKSLQTLGSVAIASEMCAWAIFLMCIPFLGRYTAF